LSCETLRMLEVSGWGEKATGYLIRVDKSLRFVGAPLAAERVQDSVGGTPPPYSHRLRLSPEGPVLRRWSTAGGLLVLDT
jgi:hypothetical protein